MKSSQKGFAPIVILLIIAVVVAGGGYYYVSHSSNDVAPSIEQNNDVANLTATTSNATSTNATSTPVKTNVTVSNDGVYNGDYALYSKINEGGIEKDVKYNTHPYYIFSGEAHVMGEKLLFNNKQNINGGLGHSFFADGLNQTIYSLTSLRNNLERIHVAEYKSDKDIFDISQTSNLYAFTGKVTEKSLSKYKVQVESTEETTKQATGIVDVSVMYPEVNLSVGKSYLFFGLKKPSETIIKLIYIQNPVTDVGPKNTSGTISDF